MTGQETPEADGGLSYVVVVNDEDQYSIWPAYRVPPAGWQARTEPAGKQACLDHIREHWTDMRPRSLREHEQAAGGPRS